MKTLEFDLVVIIDALKDYFRGKLKIASLWDFGSLDGLVAKFYVKSSMIYIVCQLC